MAIQSSEALFSCGSAEAQNTRIERSGSMIGIGLWENPQLTELAKPPAPPSPSLDPAKHLEPEVLKCLKVERIYWRHYYL